MAVPTIKLNDGRDLPVLGLGTYQSQPGEVETAIKHAIDVGYRHIDCAWFYGNEKEIGGAIREKIAEGVVKREDLFITSKLWNDAHKRDQVLSRLKEAIKNFGLDYIDLFLIHWPNADDDTDYLETWKGMEECLDTGLTKSIGVSNFNSQQIDRLLKTVRVKPVCNQVECHPYLNQTKLMEFCKERGIVLVAYCPLGKPGHYETDIIQDPVIVQLAGLYKKTPAQITLRYLIQHGVVPIPKSANPKRIAENFNIFDFELSVDDVNKLNGINKNYRLVTVEPWKVRKDYPFAVEF